MKFNQNLISLLLLIIFSSSISKVFAQGISILPITTPIRFNVSAKNSIGKLPVKIDRQSGYEDKTVTMKFQISNLPSDMKGGDILNRGLRDITFEANDIWDTLTLNFVYAERTNCSFKLIITIQSNGKEQDRLQIDILLNYVTEKKGITLTSSRTNLLNEYKEGIKQENEAYCNKKFDRTRILQPEVLDSNLNLVYANVILGADDIVKTGTAASISQDKDKGVISFNYSKLFSGGRSALNIGMNAKTSGGVYNIFSPDSWSKDIGLSLGFTKILSNNSQYFQSTDCDSIKRVRRIFLDSLYHTYNDVLSYDTVELAKERDEIIALMDNMDNFGVDTIQKKMYDSLVTINTKIASFRRIVAKTEYLDNTKREKRIKRIVQHDLAKYDFMFSKYLTGYRIQWLDAKITVGNNTEFN